MKTYKISIESNKVTGPIVKNKQGDVITELIYLLNNDNVKSILITKSE